MKLKRKSTASVIEDGRGQKYPNVIATEMSCVNDMFMEQLIVYWGIFVDDAAITAKKEPLFSGSYVWNKQARTINYTYKDSNNVSQTVQLDYDAYVDIWDDLSFNAQMNILSQTVGNFIFKLPDHEGLPWFVNWELA